MSSKYKRAHPVRCTFSDSIGITLTVSNTNGKGDEAQVITTLTPTEAKELMGNLSLFLDHVSRENVKRLALSGETHGIERAKSPVVVEPVDSKQLVAKSYKDGKELTWNPFTAKWEIAKWEDAHDANREEKVLKSCCAVDTFVQDVCSEEVVHHVGPQPASGWT